jgi:RNA polymerase sigma factor (sigma-70 family)
MEPSGLEAVFLANRKKLLRFLGAHGAGEAAEDVLQELWFRASSARDGPIASPLAYLYRAASNLMLDHHRAARQASRRDAAWSDVAGGDLQGRSDDPGSDRVLIGREQAALAGQALHNLGPRAAAIFRRHRIDGVAQREIAREMGISLSTVESDLRAAYRAMIDLRSRLDEV